MPEGGRNPSILQMGKLCPRKEKPLSQAIKSPLPLPSHLSTPAPWPLFRASLGVEGRMGGSIR